MNSNIKKYFYAALCNYLPYNTICKVAINSINGLSYIDEKLDNKLLSDILDEDSFDYVKPYLKKISDLTLKEELEYNRIMFEMLSNDPFNENGCLVKSVYEEDVPKLLEFYGKHHIDFLGLIENGLAIKIDKTNNPYT